MPLTVNLRHLGAHNIELQGELPAAELDLAVGDELIRAEKPLRYQLEVQKLENGLLLQGTLELSLDCQCVRCLKPLIYELKLKRWTRHLPLAGEEKAVVANDCVDLTPYIREDILLEFPQHPLCEADCRGLPESGAPREAKGTSEGHRDPSAWAELDKLKF